MAVLAILVVFTSVPDIISVAMLCEVPPVIPAPVGADHVYCVPAGTIPLVISTGVIANAIPLQVTAVNAFTVAFGLIATVSVKDAAAPQFTVTGVTMYVAVCTVLVVLISVPVTDATGVICDTPPTKPVPVGIDQVYSVPAGITPLVPSAGKTVNVIPLQVTVVIGVTIAVGSTVTVRVNGWLIPQPVFGVTIYVAVTAELVILLSVPVTEVTSLACDTPPVKPVPVGVDQVYKVPAGTIPLVPFTGITVKLTPLQIVVVMALILATGLIATINVNGVAFPQLGVTGVTI